VIVGVATVGVPELTVKLALATALSASPAATAKAFTVASSLRVNGTVYWVEPVVGVEPSVV